MEVLVRLGGESFLNLRVGRLKYGNLAKKSVLGPDIKSIIIA
jgi:hypothetical protein